MQITNIAIDKLNPAKYNPRLDLQPDDKEYQDIKRSIVEFGLVEPLVINKGNIIVGGHQRYKVLKELNFTTVPCITVDLDKQKEKMLNIALNKISGDWDRVIIKDLLLELDTGEYDITLTGWGEQEIEDLMTEFHVDPEEDDFDVDKAIEEIKEPICKRGDIWQLGNHFLICGDATVKEDVSRLMDGKKADMVFTDPPYGVNYQDLKKKFNKILNDKEEDIPKILKAITMFGTIPYYICCNWQSYPLFFMILKDLIDIKAVIVWDKKRGVQNLDKYYKRHEFIIYSGAFGGEKTIDGDVWELNREISDLHPTMKPIELCSKAINNSSKKDNIIVDLFGGSGSTLIACEQLNRKCYMAEIDPIYCDVIIKRFEEYSGKKAMMLNG